MERVAPSPNRIKAEEGTEIEEKQLAVLPISIYIVIRVLFPRNSDCVGLINSAFFHFKYLKIGFLSLAVKINLIFFIIYTKKSRPRKVM